MRTLAIGDIHGCYKSLVTLAKFACFSPDDLLITLGDYVNRGPNTKGVLDWLVARKAAGNLVALRGNHDVMTLDVRTNANRFEHWLKMGGDATLASYSKGKRQQSLEKIPDEHWSFLATTLPYYETATHLFVHATLLPDLPLAQQPDYALFWEKFQDPPPHESGKIMICGHTAQKTGRPKSLGYALCIDTWAYGKGWLTCLDVATGRYWQANELGQTREDSLSD